jgi:hypothetical protein
MNLIRAGLLLILLTAVARAQEKTRVYINESRSWEMTGGIGGNRDSFSGNVSGSRPRTAKINKKFNKKFNKTFNVRCPTFTITNEEDEADYKVILHHKSWQGLIRRDNKYAVYNKDGDVIASGSTRSLGNAVKNACQAIDKDLQSNPPKTTPAEN